MQSTEIPRLLELPAEERAEIAQALWESLSDEQRGDELPMSPALRAEIDQRRAEHLANPESAIPWSVARVRLLGEK